MIVFDVKHCSGCRCDFYNTSELAVGGKCLNRDSVKLVKRYRIHRDSSPRSPGAFAEVLVPDCKHGNGWFYQDSLPRGVVPVKRLRRGKV